MRAAGVAMDVTHLADQSQGVAHASTGGIMKELGFLSALDQTIPRLEKVLFLLLSIQDIVGEIANTLLDNLSTDGTGERLATKIDELLGLVAPERRTAIVFQDGSDSVYSCIDKFICKEILL